MNGLPGGHVADGCVNAAESAKGQSPLQVLGPPGKPAPSPSTRRPSCHQQGAAARLVHGSTNKLTLLRQGRAPLTG